MHESLLLKNHPALMKSWLQLCPSFPGTQQPPKRLMIKLNMYLYIDFELPLFSPVLNLLMSETIGLHFTPRSICGKEKVTIQLETGGMWSSILLPKTIVVQHFKYLWFLIKGNKLIKCLLILNIAHFSFYSPINTTPPPNMCLWTIDLYTSGVKMYS